MPVTPMSVDVAEHDLIARIMRDPVAYLGVRSPQTLQSFLTGYSFALAHHRTGRVVECVEFRGFCDWYTAQLTFRAGHAASGMNPFAAFGPTSIALLLAEDEREALDVYVAARERYRSEGGAVGAERDWKMMEEPLVTWLLSAKERWWSWFRDISGLWAHVNGFITAERDHGTPSLEVALLARFETWLRARYPFADGAPWLRIFRILSMGNPREDVEAFYEHLDMFLAQESPDAVDRSTTAMLEGIRAHVERLAHPARVAILGHDHWSRVYSGVRSQLEPLGFTTEMQRWVPEETGMIVMIVDETVEFARGMLTAIRDMYEHLPIIFLCRGASQLELAQLRAQLAWPACRFATSLDEIATLARELDERFAPDPAP